jgi:hypothetical protein
MNFKKIKNLVTAKHVLYVSIAIVLGMSFYSIGIIRANNHSESQSAVIENKDNGPSTLPMSSGTATAQKNTSVNTPSSKAQTSKPAPAQNTSQNVSRISSLPPVYTPPTYSCNQEMAANAVAIRDINISSENARYQQRLNQTSGYYSGHGLSDSSFSSNAVNIEQSIHDSNLQSINYTYKINMQNAHCL